MTRKQNAMEPIIGLVLLDLATVDAYGIALEACTTKEIRDQLESFRGDHERHVRELSEWVRSQGGEPPTQIDPSGEIIRGYTDLASEEERSAILVMQGNEELTNQAYASALRAKVPEDVRAIVVRNFEDERRHAAWLRGAIKLRGWDHEAPELRELAEQVLPKAA
ncbi:hypothetical protein A7982_13864 [Minicystis rosea]|nr:hypothetical protein A7982_13864 [Minicystis rosea]